ncbi:MAG: Fe-S cluster assembly protein SufD [Salinivirgaceae bacterium]|nr:Fe-S cluster assembly protein SufD [Salinivirgaceae bacterium]
MERVNSAAIKDKLTALYRQYSASICSGMPEQVNRQREAAIRFFSDRGLPEKGCERYRFTNVMAAFGHTYAYAINPNNENVDSKKAFHCAVPGLDTYTITVGNGWIDTANSTIPDGVVATGLAEGAQRYSDLFAQHYNRLAAAKDDTIISLNTAFARSGLFLYIPDNVTIDKPIQIVNILSGDNPLMVNQRNLIVAGSGSQAKIVFCDHTLSERQFLLNNVTEIVMLDGSQLDCYSIQNLNDHSSQISSVMIEQNTDSQLLANTLTLHGGFVRNNLEVLMNGSHAEANIYGLSLPNGHQHVDNFTYIDHAVPECTSYELYKNVLNGHAVGAFGGYVLVRPNAQKTNAMQSNKNICVSSDSRMYTKPQLEIYADDVKCSHGATIGQLDENALFYMRQRGIGEDEARMMLMSAFAHEVVRTIRIPILADRYAEMIENRLRGRQAACGDCFMKCDKR